MSSICAWEGGALAQCVSSENQVNEALATYRRLVCPIHSYSTIINRGAIIGRNCIVYHCLTIGVERSGVPIIGDNVTIGVGAIILGGIHVDNNVNIGVGVIVVKDVSDDSTVVGVQSPCHPM